MNILEPEKGRRMRSAIKSSLKIIIFYLISGLLLFFPESYAETPGPCPEIKRLLGANDSVLVTDKNGCRVFGHNPHKKLIPASTLKVLTASAAFRHLGPDYQFPTEFYVNDKKDLIIKGYGDPLLVSETVAAIAQTLKSRIGQVHDLVLDDSYFQRPIDIPGVSADSLQPYNAPNGALCVNFNTVDFKKESGRIISAEPQTPMLPIALERIRGKNSSAGRILLSDKSGDTLLYAGQLFRYFLNQAGVETTGGIRAGDVCLDRDRLIYRHLSEYKLTAVIEKLFEYSNNYMANQILLSIGAKIYGPPATLDKGVNALKRYCETHLSIPGIRLVEGSGISRKNRVSAEMFIKILDAFSPYYTLMANAERIYFKTGTLNGIQTRVGYIESEKLGLCRFVILLNTRGKRCEPILSEINKWVP